MESVKIVGKYQNSRVLSLDPLCQFYELTELSLESQSPLTSLKVSPYYIWPSSLFLLPLASRIPLKGVSSFKANFVSLKKLVFHLKRGEVRFSNITEKIKDKLELSSAKHTIKCAKQNSKKIMMYFFVCGCGWWLPFNLII